MGKLLMLMIVLATPVLTGAQDEAARMAAGCGPNEVQFDVKTDKKQHLKGELAPGKALVYIFDHRSGKNLGAWPNARVGVDGSWVGANRKASYFFFSIAPGNHNICTSSKGTFERLTNASLVATTFTAEAGQIYYFSIKFHNDSGWKLQEIAPAQAELQIGALPSSTFSQRSAKPPQHREMGCGVLSPEKPDCWTFSILAVGNASG